MEWFYNIINSGWFNLIWPFIFLVIKVLVIIVVILLCVAYLTWLERKIHAAVHLRKGPNVNGMFGLLQPIFDGVKLLLKEIIIPDRANKLIFLMAPVLSFVTAIAAWAVIPIGNHLVFSDINVGILYLMAISSLGVYGIMMAGWSSNSNYAMLGSIRSSAQIISYELSMGVLIATVILNVGSFNLSDIVMAQEHCWFIFKLLPAAVLFFIITLAETNRLPFDLPEAEAELVSGYNVEYSGFAFALFFLGEYANMILMSSITTILFLGGWLPILNIGILNYIPGIVWFVVKVIILLSLMILMRSILPRYRYDQLMKLGWKWYLPISCGFFVIVAFCLRFL
ncbi:NADH-quinone oxidoreductase subunit NuoH [Rickettsiales bacterium LUAb2]